MNFGSGERPTYRDDWTIDEAASREVIDHAIENGINFIDTANIYSTGDSERIVGNAIADYDRDELVIEHADPRPEDTVLDLGAGTGLIALALAEDAGYVVGHDISDGMIEQARSKAADSGIENVEFGYGKFRDPQYDNNVDIVVSNFALHHLPDDQEREVIEVIADLGPRRFVLGDAMFFESSDPEDPLFGHGVDAATVGMLVDVLTDVGFTITTADRVHDQVGVLVAERTTDGVESGAASTESVTNGEEHEH